MSDQTIREMHYELNAVAWKRLVDSGGAGAMSTFCVAYERQILSALGYHKEWGWCIARDASDLIEMRRREIEKGGVYGAIPPRGYAEFESAWARYKAKFGR